MFVIFRSPARISAEWLGCFRGPLQFRHARLDVLDLDRFRCVIEDRSRPRGRTEAGVLGSSRSLIRVVAAAEVPCWSRAMDWAEGGTARIPVGLLELGYLLPAEQRRWPRCRRRGPPLPVALGEQCGDCLLHLAAEFCSVSSHLASQPGTSGRSKPDHCRHSSISQNCLACPATGVIHVMTAQSVAPRRTIMKTFTIDDQNNISAFATQEEAAATTATPFDTFASQKELVSLVGQWPADRLVAIWNSLPGVKPVKSFKTRQGRRGPDLGAHPKPWAKPPKPKAERKAKAGAQAAKGAPAKGKATKKATPAKKAPKAKKAAKIEQERWAARRQQDRPGGRDAAAQGRRHAGGDHGPDGLAEAHRPRVHGRRDEEGRVHRRVLQVREGRAHLPDQPVAPAPSLLARPASAAAGFSASGPELPRHVRRHCSLGRHAQSGAARANVGQTWRNGGQPLARLQQPQFRRPVRPAPGTALPRPDAQRGVALRCPRSPGGSERFTAATFRRSSRDLLERSAVAVERGFLARQRLPALDHDVHVLRIQLDSAADALGEFRGRQRRAAAQERLVHQFAALGVVQDRAPHQLDRLLRRVIELLLVASRP